jgi:hypothetical protein
MLGSYIKAAQRRRKRFVVYSDAAVDLAAQFSTRNVTVERRELPEPGPDPFVNIYDGERFLGAISLANLQMLLEPPIDRPTEDEGIGDAYRALLEVLDGTVFSTLDRRQLQATSREFETRALQVGHGTLRVGFQSLAAFAPQTAEYRHLGEATDLDIHVYGQPDWTPPTIPNVTYHRDTEGVLTPYWFLAFDGGDNPSQRCALIAKEGDDGYWGFWSYDSSLVGDILETLRAGTESD